MTLLFLLAVTWRPTGRSAAEDDATAQTERRATIPFVLPLHRITNITRCSAAKPRLLLSSFLHPSVLTLLMQQTIGTRFQPGQQKNVAAQGRRAHYFPRGHFGRIRLHTKLTNSDANARRRLSSALDWPPDCWIICKIGSAQAAFVIICRTQVWNLLPVQSKRRDAEAMPGLSRVTVPELRRRRRGASSHRLAFSLAACLIAFWLLRLLFPTPAVSPPACRPLVFKLTLSP